MPTVSTVIANPDFELGNTGWSGSGWNITSAAGNAFAGTWQGQKRSDDVGSSASELVNENVVSVYTGQSITAKGRIRGVGGNGNVGSILIQWLNSSFVPISFSQGNASNNGSHNVWEVSAVTASAPAGVAYARIGFWGQNVVNGEIYVDNAEWNYVAPATISLLSPTTGATYQFGDTVPLKILAPSGSAPIQSVAYKDGATTIASSSVADYSYNVSTLALGSHTITAEVTLVGGTVVTTNAATITITALPVVIPTIEYKASNAYTYLLGQNISNIASSIPSVAKIVGVEIEMDYKLKILLRSKDIGIAEPTASNTNVAFDVIDGGTIEAAMIESSGTSSQLDGVALTTHIPIVRSDFSTTSSGVSEGKKWTVMDGDIRTAMLGRSDAFFGLDPAPLTDFLTRGIGFRFLPNLATKPDYADTGDMCIRFMIDKIRARIYFNAGSAEYYFASPDKSQIIKGSLISSSVGVGDFKTGDASGQLQLSPTLEIMLGTQTWIGNDWTIHAAYPPTTANQIGSVTTREAGDGIGITYNGLPAAGALVANRTRYQFITSNFYAVKTLDSIYGAHGLPRAFAFNGTSFYKIYTQPLAEKDQPRHVANHHGHLALGFDDGRVDISVIGKPYNFNGVDGASEWAIGDKVTGLLPLSGAILGVFGSKSIWGISGTTVDNFATQVIAPNIGATEYTVTDMGFPVYANAYGIYTLSQSAQYGDYLGTPMSQDVSPWLRPRLQRKGTSTKEVVAAWPVRSKNQYRLAFADGYVMSMTLNAGQQSSPTFSFQKYTIYGVGDV